LEALTTYSTQGMNSPLIIMTFEFFLLSTLFSTSEI
jgi:hypothetical protein